MAKIYQRVAKHLLPLFCLPVFFISVLHHRHQQCREEAKRMHSGRLQVGYRPIHNWRGHFDAGQGTQGS